MPSSGLSIGLNLPSKAKKPTKAPRPKRPLAAFDDGDDDAAAPAHSGEDAGGGNIFGGGGGGGGGGVLKNKQPQSKKKSGKDISVVNAQLATFNELSKMAEKSAAATAEVEDPSIYDYDGVWEDMKSVDRRKKKADELDAIERKPKYMENLLVAAEVRKRDQLRAKEKLLQKEREAEGDEFADKESFVTEAYKKQQEELKKIEEEERLREESLKKKSQGMSTFHRNMLNKMESKHDELVAAARSKSKDVQKDEENADRDQDVEKAAAERAQKLREKGAAIELNEEGLVVDKTQLLSGGLNVTATKKPPIGSRSTAEVRRPQQGYQGRNRAQQDLRARQTKMLEEQLAQAQKRALEEDEKSKAELERQAKSRKTQTDVQSARERYLARKAAAAKEK